MLWPRSMQNTTLSRVCCGYARRRRLAARRLACGRRGATPAGICVHTSNQLRAGGHAAAQRAQRARRARGQLRRVERQRRDRRPLGAPHREGDGRRLSCARPGEGWAAGNGRLALQRLHCAASCSPRPPHPVKCSGAARRNSEKSKKKMRARAILKFSEACQNLWTVAVSVRSIDFSRSLLRKARDTYREITPPSSRLEPPQPVAMCALCDARRAGQGGLAGRAACVPCCWWRGACTSRLTM